MEQNTSSKSNNLVTIVILFLIVGVGIYLTVFRTNTSLSTTKESGVPQPSNTNKNVTSPGTQVEPMSSATPTPTVTTSTSIDKTFTVTAKNFSYDITTLTVNQGDQVVIKLVNSEGMHDIVFTDFNARTKVIKAGETDTIEFVADKKGQFEYFCSVGSHRAMGMKGMFIVN